MWRKHTERWRASRIPVVSRNCSSIERSLQDSRGAIARVCALHLLPYSTFTFICSNSVFNSLSLSLTFDFLCCSSNIGHKNGVWRRVRHHITVVGLRHHICHSIFLCRHRRQFCRFCLDALPFYCLPPYNSPFPVNTNTIAIELCYTLLVTKCNSQHKVCC